MKHAAIALAICFAAVLSAGDVSVPLNSAKIGDATIPGWVLNKSHKADDYGKGEVIAGSEADEKAFKVTPPADRGISFYSGKAYPAKVGYKLEFSADVKGKGTVTFGFYAYNETGNKYIGGLKNHTKTFQLTDKLTEVKAEIFVEATPLGEIGAIRPVISVSKDSELVIEDIDIDIEDDKD